MGVFAAINERLMAHYSFASQARSVTVKGLTSNGGNSWPQDRGNGADTQVGFVTWGKGAGSAQQGEHQHGLVIGLREHGRSCLVEDQGAGHVGGGLGVIGVHDAAA